MIYPDIVLVLLPFAFFAVKLTVYFPFLLYVCTGFLEVEDVPSPKLHLHEVGDPVLLSVNVTFNGTFPEVEDAEKEATGAFRAVATFIWLDFVTELLPAALVTVKPTVYFPAPLYVCVGFLSVEVVPSPKLHFQLVGVPVLLSLNVTFIGEFPVIGDAENEATGFCRTVFTFIVAVFESVPFTLLTVSITV